jgi:ketosteroid isomerase-like protein
MVRQTFLAVLLVVVLSSCTMWKNPPKGWAGATGGEQLERLFWDDIQSKNWTSLEKHLEPMFVATSPNATRDRAEAISHWKTYDLQSVNLADIQVHTAGADFTVTAIVTVTGTADGKPIASEPVHTMTVWQQVGSRWVAVAHSDPLP